MAYHQVMLLHCDIGFDKSSLLNGSKPIISKCIANTIMANMSILGPQTLQNGILPTPPNVNPLENIRVSIPSLYGPPNTTRLENARLVFPNMPKTLPIGTPSNIVKSLVMFH